MGALRVMGVRATSEAGKRLIVKGVRASGPSAGVFPRLRVMGVRASGGSVATLPRLRIMGVKASGGVVGGTPRLQIMGVKASGPHGVTLNALAPQTARYHETVSATATVAYGDVTAWVWRQVSGPPVTLNANGANVEFLAPAVFPPGAQVVLGVTAYSNGVASAERLLTVDITPVRQWRRVHGGDWKPGWWLLPPEKVPTAPTREIAGALPIGTAAYSVPSNVPIMYVAKSGNNNNPGTIGSPKATVAAAAAAVPAGGVVRVRGGQYDGQIGSITKPVTIMNYPGEAVWFDGLTTTQVVGVSSAAVGWMGLGFRRYNVTNDGSFTRGLVFPGTASNSIVENCYFEDFLANVTVAAYNGTGPLRIFNNDDVLVRKNSFFRSGVFHVYTDRTTNLQIQNNYFEKSNMLGHNPQPLAAAVKHCRAYRFDISNNYSKDNTNGQGFWLDVSCYDGDIHSNYVEGGYEAILIELSGTVRAFNNHIVSGRTYGLRALCSSQVIAGWNSIVGKTGLNPHILLGVLQDERFNNGSEGYLAEGVTWIAKDNELIGNTLSGQFAYGQVGVYDYTAPDKGGPTHIAADMIDLIAGNQYNPRPDGRNESFQWSSAPAGSNFAGKSLTQLIAAHPGLVKRENAPMHAKIAAKLGLPTGTMQIGPVTPPPIPMLEYLQTA